MDRDGEAHLARWIREVGAVAERRRPRAGAARLRSGGGGELGRRGAEEAAGWGWGAEGEAGARIRRGRGGRCGDRAQRGRRVSYRT